MLGFAAGIVTMREKWEVNLLVVDRVEAKRAALESEYISKIWEKGKVENQNPFQCCQKGESFGLKDRDVGREKFLY